jgi:hypothetical protein
MCDAKRHAAIIGPTVCELDGPMPILNRSKTLTFMASFAGCDALGFAFQYDAIAPQASFGR